MRVAPSAYKIIPIRIHFIFICGLSSTFHPGLSNCVLINIIHYTNIAGEYINKLRIIHVLRFSDCNDEELDKENNWSKIMEKTKTARTTPTEDKARIRCQWVTKDPLYIKYHDEEWGKPELDNFRLFEMLCLEGQQAGLSWITILKKRENYRKYFCNFDPYKILTLTESDLNKILQDNGVVRHKGKLESIKNNAKCYVDMEKNGEDFSDFIWSFVNHKPVINIWTHPNEIPTETKTSLALANALKKRGFKFVGNTICYAFMQACGLVNDHVDSCIYKTKGVQITD